MSRPKDVSLDGTRNKMKKAPFISLAEMLRETRSGAPTHAYLLYHQKRVRTKDVAQGDCYVLLTCGHGVRVNKNGAWANHPAELFPCPACGTEDNGLALEDTRFKEVPVNDAEALTDWPDIMIQTVRDQLFKCFNGESMYVKNKDEDRVILTPEILDDVLGLPYTSSSAYAGLWVTNSDVDIFDGQRIAGFLVTNRHEVVMLTKEPDETEHWHVCGYTDFEGYLHAEPRPRTFRNGSAEYV